MFGRRIIRELREWAASSDRKPLIIRGARQVGKTTAVDMFSKEFDAYIYLDLQKRKDAELFERGLSIEELLQAIFLAKNAHRTEGRTLLFIDEIQNSPDAVAMMRYFYESAKDLYVISAGSLLEIMMSDRQISFPVGRVQYLFMYPLTFEEFLLAIGAEQACEIYNTVPLPDFAFSELKDKFHKYALIGGMPEIVKIYSEEQDITATATAFQALLTSYLDDVSKYARNSTMVEIIRHAIESSPTEAGKRIKFHGFGNSNYRSREMGEALRILERAMLVYLLYPSTVTEPPIRPDKRKSPRLQFLDTGLINYFAGLQEQFFRHDDLHAFYRGLLAEHIVGQELLAADFRKQRKPVFWVREKKQSSAEIDFLVQHGRFAIPVEVKSGPAGKLRSLHQFVDHANHLYAVRLYSEDIKLTTNLSVPGCRSFQLLNLPYFLAGKLQDYLEWFF